MVSSFPAALLLCVVCFLLPRVWGLGRNWTADEKHWLERSYNFINAVAAGDFRGTVQSVHPGVVTMWTLGLTQRFMGYRARPGEAPGPSPDDVNEGKLRIMKGGLIAVCLGLYVVIFWLLRRLLGATAGLIAALFIGLDPLLAGYTRCLHLDGIYVLAGFGSVLATLTWCFDPGRRVRWAAVAGVLAGLATLNRSQGVIFAAFFCVCGMVAAVRTLMAGSGATGRRRRTAVAVGLFVCCWALVIYAGFPALWRLSFSGLRDVLSGGVELASRQHRHPLYFLGRRFYEAPDYFQRNMLYWFILLFRMSPAVTVPFVFGTLFFAAKGVGFVVSLTPTLSRGEREQTDGGPVSRGEREQTDGGPVCRGEREVGAERAAIAAICTVAIIGYIALIAIGRKATSDGRYILLAFPLAATVAAMHLTSAGELLRRRWPAGLRGAVTAVVIFVFPVLSLATAVQAMPYPLAYASPLIGGVDGYQRVSCYGWGEGFYEVAWWLNARGAPNEVVATNYRGLEPYYAGRIVPLKGVMRTVVRDADVVVLYRSAVLRDMPSGVDDLKRELDTGGWVRHEMRVLGGTYFTIYEIRRNGVVRQ